MVLCGHDTRVVPLRRATSPYRSGGGWWPRSRSRAVGVAGRGRRALIKTSICQSKCEGLRAKTLSSCAGQRHPRARELGQAQLPDVTATLDAPPPTFAGFHKDCHCCTQHIAEPETRGGSKCTTSDTKVHPTAQDAARPRPAPPPQPQPPTSKNCRKMGICVGDGPRSPGCIPAVSSAPPAPGSCSGTSNPRSRLTATLVPRKLASSTSPKEPSPMRRVISARESEGAHRAVQ